VSREVVHAVTWMHAKTVRNSIFSILMKLQAPPALTLAHPHPSVSWGQ
jgi:hypothetical protein